LPEPLESIVEREVELVDRVRQLMFVQVFLQLRFGPGKTKIEFSIFSTGTLNVGTAA
jgi:hypothetical protein